MFPQVPVTAGLSRVAVSLIPASFPLDLPQRHSAQKPWSKVTVMPARLYAPVAAAVLLAAFAAGAWLAVRA